MVQAKQAPCSGARYLLLLFLRFLPLRLSFLICLTLCFFDISHRSCRGIRKAWQERGFCAIPCKWEHAAPHAVHHDAAGSKHRTLGTIQYQLQGIEQQASVEIMVQVDCRAALQLVTCLSPEALAMEVVGFRGAQ